MMFDEFIVFTIHGFLQGLALEAQADDRLGLVDRRRGGRGQEVGLERDGRSSGVEGGGEALESVDGAGDFRLTGGRRRALESRPITGRIAGATVLAFRVLAVHLRASRMAHRVRPGQGATFLLVQLVRKRQFEGMFGAGLAGIVAQGVGLAVS